MNITAYDLAQRFVGIKEVPGSMANPQIMAMLNLDAKWPEDDSVPWCSGFVNYIAWLLRLPRSKSLRARSWLEVGIVVSFKEARCGNDVVILKRGSGDQPGREVINAPGHVAFYSEIGWQNNIWVLGGNQSNTVSMTSYPTESVLGIRRLGNG